MDATLATEFKLFKNLRLACRVYSLHPGSSSLGILTTLNEWGIVETWFNLLLYGMILSHSEVRFYGLSREEGKKGFSAI